jgi:hypothetical protein
MYNNLKHKKYPNTQEQASWQKLIKCFI